MPKINVYTAETKPAILNQPLRFLETGESQAAPLIAQAQKFGEQLSVLAGNMQAHSAQLEFLQGKADYEAGVAEINLILPRDPAIIADPLLFEVEYTRRSNEVQRNVTKSIKSERAREQFQAYSAREFQGEFVKARAAGLRLLDAKLAGQFLIEKNRLGNQAAEASTPAEFKANNELFEDLVEDSYKRKLLTATEREQELITFREQVAEKNMRFIGSQDPTKMRKLNADGFWKDVPSSRKIAILEHVASQEEALANRKRAQFAEVRKINVDGLESRANFGKLTDEELDRGQRGLDPMHPDPTDWNRLATLNENAPGLRTVDQTQNADSVRLLYRLRSSPTRQDAVDALEELDALRAAGGSRKTMKAISDAANEIQGDIRMLDAATLAAERSEAAIIRGEEARERARRNEAAVQLSRKVHDALVEFDRIYKRSPLGARMGRMDDIKRRALRADLESLVRSNPGLDNKEAIERVLGTPEQQRQKAKPDAIDLFMKER